MLISQSMLLDFVHAFVLYLLQQYCVVSYTQQRFIIPVYISHFSENTSHYNKRNFIWH